LGAVISSSVLVLGLGLAACGQGRPGDASKTRNPVSTTLAKLKGAGKIIVGVKADQPGIGFRNPATGQFEGFDIEMAKIVAAGLGFDPSKIEFKETVSKNREAFIKNNTVDIVIASYSITPDRRQVVSQVGPYYETGQQLLVREEDKSRITGPDKLKGVKVCSVTGSTSIKTVEEQYGAQPVPFSTYTECVQQLLSKSVDVVTTDGAILLGYAAQQPDKLEVVGPAFSKEAYGIGFKKPGGGLEPTERPDQAFCDFLSTTIQKSFQDGAWKKAFDATLGKSGAPAPSPPALDNGC
jgi:glutamate transport system substrate-binding protein